jgi:hypothetical protein
MGRGRLKHKSGSKLFVCENEVSETAHQWEPSTQHRLTRNMFDAWLRRPGGSPADVASKTRLHGLLGTVEYGVPAVQRCQFCGAISGLIGSNSDRSRAPNWTTERPQACSNFRVGRLTGTERLACKSALTRPPPAVQ